MKQPKIYSILPKLLHRPPQTVKIPSKISTLTPLFFTFYDTKMDFYFRKVLKHNKIKYIWHRKDRILTINTYDAPFRFFMQFETNSNYITIRRIPIDEYEYLINAIHMDELIQKLLRYNIIYPRSLKSLIVPINYQAQQLRLIYGY